MSGVALFVLLLGVGFDLFLYVRKHPRRFVYSWAATTVTLTPLLALMFADSGQGVVQALGGGALFGAAAYPAIRAVFWTQATRYQQYEEQRLEAERLRYRPTDFGGRRASFEVSGAPPKTTAADADVTATPGPLTAPAASSPLVEVTAQARPRWAGSAELALIVLVSLVGGGLFIWLRFSPGPDPATAVAEALEDAGYGPVRLEPDGPAASCSGEPYRRSTAGAEGHACFHHRRATVDVWVDRDWRKANAPVNAGAVPPSRP